ncbi:MAG: N-6 DNA methylase, partial [bacterium]|nr:N-6 DNA methylase [bacterium]
MKEAKSRIRINKFLENAGWRFFDNDQGKANICLESNVKITGQTLNELGEDFEKTTNGFVDFLLLDEQGFPMVVLEAKREDKNPLDGKEQARKYARSLNVRFIILSNGNLPPDERKRLIENFSGYDISPDMVRLSLVNMYLHDFQNPKIYEYDTLTSEEKWGEFYDVILANPPFMTPKGGIRPHNRFSVQANRSEVLFVDYIAEHLNVHGRAGVIVLEGIIFQSANAYKALRKMLVDSGYLYAVVSLPAGVFNPYSEVKTSILLMDKTLAKKTRNILFVKVENDGFDLGAQRSPISGNDIPHILDILLKYKQEVSKGEEPVVQEEDKIYAHIVAKEKIVASGDYNLSGNRYKETVSF